MITIQLFVLYRKSNYNRNDSSSSSSTNANSDAQKRFANAKAISSDQYFGNKTSEVSHSK